MLSKRILFSMVVVVGLGIFSIAAMAADRHFVYTLQYKIRPAAKPLDAASLKLTAISWDEKGAADCPSGSGAARQCKCPDMPESGHTGIPANMDSIGGGSFEFDSVRYGGSDNFYLDDVNFDSANKGFLVPQTSKYLVLTVEVQVDEVKPESRVRISQAAVFDRADIYRVIDRTVAFKDIPEGDRGQVSPSSKIDVFRIKKVDHDACKAAGTCVSETCPLDSLMSPPAGGQGILGAIKFLTNKDYAIYRHCSVGGVIVHCGRW